MAGRPRGRGRRRDVGVTSASRGSGAWKRLSVKSRGSQKEQSA
jgi:hypothetical protein